LQTTWQGRLNKTRVRKSQRRVKRVRGDQKERANRRRPSKRKPRRRPHRHLVRRIKEGSQMEWVELGLSESSNVLYDIS